MSRPHEIAAQDQSTRALRAPVAETATRPANDLSPDPAPEPGIVCRADLVRDDLTGLAIGPYELGQRIGHGGMGTVFRARHVRLGKSFAIKFITSDVASSNEAQARFEQEVRALGALQHPNIVSAVDAGRGGGLQFLVTELIEGEDFAQLVERRGLIEVPEACELIRQAAIGLRYSHAARFVHRDVKPSNLILDRNGIVKILDFGLVRNIVAEDRVTQLGGMMGTWDFVAPEQAHDARTADERGDIYGLGCTLLYLLSGRVPFGEERYSGAAAKLKGHLFDRAPWFDRVPVHVPPELAAFLERMLAKSPDARVQTAAETAEVLAKFSHGAELSRLWGTPAVRPIDATATPAVSRRSTPRSLIAAGATLLIGTSAALLHVAVGRSSPPSEPSGSETAATNAPVHPDQETSSEKPASEPAANQPAPIAATAPAVTQKTKQALNASAARVALPTFAPRSGATAKSSLAESTPRED